MTLAEKIRDFTKSCKKPRLFDLLLALHWPFGMIFGSSDAEFQVELEDTKKCIHQKLPKQRDSNGKSERPSTSITCTFYSDHSLAKYLPGRFTGRK